MGIEKQSRRMSLIEAIANVAIGYAVALLTQIIVFPLFALQVSLGDNLAIGGLFTLASIGRSYVLRRVFEAIRVHTAQTQNGRARTHMTMSSSARIGRVSTDKVAGLGCG